MKNKFDMLYENIMDELNNAHVENDGNASCEICGKDEKIENLIKNEDGSLTCKDCANQNQEIKTEEKDYENKMYAKIEYDDKFGDYIIYDIYKHGVHEPRQKGYKSEKDAIKILLDEGYEKVGKNEYCGNAKTIIDNQETLRAIENN